MTLSERHIIGEYSIYDAHFHVCPAIYGVSSCVISLIYSDTGNSLTSQTLQL